jgi:hypothetical protein
MSVRSDSVKSDLRDTTVDIEPWHTRQRRIRAIVPNLMGYDAAKLPASYHAFYDAKTGVPRPNDGRPVYEGLRPEFAWPAPA